MRFAAIFTLLSIAASGFAAPPAQPAIIGHRGLLREAPENTLANFAACIDLGLGFELDARRTKDGVLVVLHDETVDRTTNGAGKVADLILADVQKLDAGAWFDPAFTGQRVPTLEATFQLVREHKSKVLIAVDLKIEDANYEGDIVALGKKHGVLGQLVFIGRAIDEPAVRKKLRTADKDVNVCALAQTAKDLPAAITDSDSNWVYTRFIPTIEEVQTIRKAGKKLFLSGPPVNQLNAENFRKALDIRADALLTDYPHDCRRTWRADATPKK
jgi:glycerophosphoryl diester phosphodiesterase